MTYDQVGDDGRPVGVGDDGRSVGAGDDVRSEPGMTEGRS